MAGLAVRATPGEPSGVARHPKQPATQLRGDEDHSGNGPGARPTPRAFRSRLTERSAELRFRWFYSAIQRCHVRTTAKSAGLRKLKNRASAEGPELSTKPRDRTRALAFLLAMPVTNAGSMKLDSLDRRRVYAERPEAPRLVRHEFVERAIPVQTGGDVAGEAVRVCLAFLVTHHSSHS